LPFGIGQDDGGNDIADDDTERCTQDEEGHVEADVFFISDGVYPNWEVDQIEHLTKATN